MSRVTEEKRSLWQRIKRLAMTDVGALVRGLNADDLETMERLLIEADFGVPATLELVQTLEDGVRDGKLKTEADLRNALVDRLVAMLESPGEAGRIAKADPGPTVVVIVAAADTYRAGAIAQLEVWAARLGLACVSGAPGGDPAAVAFDAIDAAVARDADTVVVDTAGRLHTQEGLMAELGKVTRVVSRRLPGAPHETLLVLDGTVGQNAIQQGRLFTRAVNPTGIIVTKLDGSARGGAVAALRRELELPIRFLGMGESADDLEPFDPRRFAESLLTD